MLYDKTRARLDEQGASGEKAAEQVLYAGPWKRLAAGAIDAFVIPAAWYLSSFIMGGYFRAAGNGEDLSDYTARLINYAAWAAGFAAWWLYCILMERSANRGTVGKMLMGIAVTDAGSGRISLMRALTRNLAKIVSGALLPVNWLMVAVTGKKQGLHDLISGSMVVVKR